MTLDEAIKHCEEAAEDRDKLSKRYDDASGYSRSHNEAIRTNEAKECEKCSQDFRQLAGWLKELKALKAEPCTDAISRAEMLKYQEYLHGKMPNEENHKLWEFIKGLPSVTPKQKTGKPNRWIQVSEKLPEDHQRVLITIVNYHGDNVVRVAEYHNRGKIFQVKENRESWEVGEEGFLAWMPLPEPYKAGSETKS